MSLEDALLYYFRGYSGERFDWKVRNGGPLGEPYVECWICGKRVRPRGVTIGPPYETRRGRLSQAYDNHLSQHIKEVTTEERAAMRAIWGMRGDDVHSDIDGARLLEQVLGPTRAPRIDPL